MAFLNFPSPPLPPPLCADRETTPPAKPVPATETTGCGRTARETTGQIGRPFVSRAVLPHPVDRKSTRLNSSHANISYAVFCLKKKTKKTRSKNNLNKNQIT